MTNKTFKSGDKYVNIAWGMVLQITGYSKSKSEYPYEVLLSIRSNLEPTGYKSVFAASSGFANSLYDLEYFLNTAELKHVFIKDTWKYITKSIRSSKVL
jgi:hypothetical protein